MCPTLYTLSLWYDPILTGTTRTTKLRVYIILCDVFYIHYILLYIPYTNTRISGLSIYTVFTSRLSSFWHTGTRNYTLMGIVWGCVNAQKVTHNRRLETLNPFVQQGEEQIECAVCLENIIYEGEICPRCGQAMHVFCLKRWKYSCMKRGVAFSCPLCRCHFS